MCFLEKNQRSSYVLMCMYSRCKENVVLLLLDSYILESLKLKLQFFNVLVWIFKRFILFFIFYIFFIVDNWTVVFDIVIDPATNMKAQNSLECHYMVLF